MTCISLADDQLETSTPLKTNNCIKLENLSELHSSKLLPVTFQTLDYLTIFTNDSSPTSQGFYLKCHVPLSWNSHIGLHHLSHKTQGDNQHELASPLNMQLATQLHHGNFYKVIDSGRTQPVYRFTSSNKHQKNGKASHDENSTEAKFPTRAPITSSPWVSLLNHPCKIICLIG